MDNQYWIDRWKTKQTQFHQDTYHDKLVRYFPISNITKNQRVLVPLCGKTKDMLWLHAQGLQVDGIEVANEAVTSFFEEEGSKIPHLTHTDHFKVYSENHITLYNGDIFKFNYPNTYDYIYDRGSLVALPEEKRQTYVDIMTASLKTQGHYLLITYHYDQTEMTGPPFSLSQKEIQNLFGHSFQITQLESDKESDKHSRLSQIPSLTQDVYLLKKQ